jgi:hypothetical protein
MEEGGQEINGTFVMDDAIRKLFLYLARSHKRHQFRHPPTDDTSEGSGLPGPVARPHISLKARMLGGQAKTVMRLGGSLR